MNYKEPDKEQIELMEKYSSICTHAIDIIMQCEQNVMLQHASARLQESMSWFSTYVVNGGKLVKDKESMN